MPLSLSGTWLRPNQITPFVVLLTNTDICDGSSPSVPDVSKEQPALFPLPHLTFIPQCSKRRSPGKPQMPNPGCTFRLYCYHLSEKTPPLAPEPLSSRTTVSFFFNLPLMLESLQPCIRLLLFPQSSFVHPSIPLEMVTSTSLLS